MSQQSFIETGRGSVRNIPTSHGIFLATFSNHGLARLDFPQADRTHCEKPGRSGIPLLSHRLAAPRTTASRSASIQLPAQILARWEKLTTEALAQVLKGRAPKSLPPLDLSWGTAFQQRVWRVLQSIPVGATLSYGEIARRLRQPQGARAVGGACGANPIPVLVPCHRVLAARQRLGGFSGGLDWKKKLLAIEGIIIAERISRLKRPE